MSKSSGKDKEKDNILYGRLNKILETRIENDEDTLEALTQLSTFYTVNTLQARRNLRSQIEKRSLDINKSFLTSLKDVKEAFEDIYNDVATMNVSIRNMSTRLQNAKLQTKQLLERTKALQELGQTNDMRRKISAAFIHQFQLPPELATLSGNKNQQDITINSKIFSALDHLQEIRNNCKYLMQMGYQSLALDIMEQMNAHHENVLEQLYRWAQNSSRNVSNPQLTDLVTQVMARLQDQPVLFKYVIDEYCTARRSFLVGEFINALTRGGSNGNPAPIELRAHDPQIYLTDMLVWLNKAIMAEKQNLELLVKLCDKSKLGQQLNGILANICEGICQPLSIRIEKILYTKIQAATLYSIINLIRYYKKCICKIAGGGLLESVLNELQDKSEQTFSVILNQQVNAILVKAEAPPRDLTPTSSIIQTLALLRDMLSTASMSEGRETDMDKIAHGIMNPLMMAMNEQASRLPPTDMAVYLLNCMYSMYTCLSLYEFMEERLERLQAQSDAQIDTLISEQVGSLVANLNLGSIYTILQDQSHGPLSGIPGMEPNNIKKLLGKLEYVFTEPDEVLLTQITLLSSSKHKKAVQKRAFEVLLAIYKQLYEKVHNPESLYEDPHEILNKTSDELALLLTK